MMVNISVVSIRNLEAIEGEAIKLLDRGRYERMMSYCRREDRLRSLGSSLLMRRAAHGGQVLCNEAGKPYISDGYFNISHSGDYVVLAEAEAAVGVDIEKIGTSVEDWMKLALSPDEYEWMVDRASGEESMEYWFYLLWTRKESLVKCEGHGFSLDEPNEIEILPVDSAVQIPYRGKRYGIESWPYDGCMLSVSLEEAIPELLLRDGAEVWRELLEV